MDSKARGELFGSVLALALFGSVVTAQQFERACPEDGVQAPPGWYVGDTHEHFQLCHSPPTSVNHILDKMRAKSLDVASVLIWGNDIDTQADFDSRMANVTGSEDPVSVGLPEIIQFGVEVSAFTAAKMGHVMGLNITNAETDFFDLGLGCAGSTDMSGDYAAPILDLWLQNPNAVTGYAHVFWPVETHVDQANGGWDWENPFLPNWVGEDARCSFNLDMAFPDNVQITANHPVTASTDVVMRRIHFLEAIEMQNALNSQLEERWYGMPYKLLNAGLRISLAAGTDVDCVHQSAAPRTWVLIDDGASLSYEQWVDNLAEGRVTLAAGKEHFLNLKVNGQPLGSEIQLSGASAEVTVKATYIRKSLEPRSDTIEIVQDGVVVHSQTFAPFSEGRRSVEVMLPVTRSGWLAARTASNSTHTGFTHIIHDGKPVANCAEAEYWMIYADYIHYTLNAGGLPGYVGCSGQEIRDYLTEGRKVFAAIRDYDLPLPTNVTRYGTSAPPECTQPIGIVTTTPPVINTSMTFRCFNAPSETSGWLWLSGTQDLSGTPFYGSILHLIPTPTSFLSIPVTTNKAGYAEVTPPPLPPLVGFTGYAQFLWVNPAGCQQTGVLSSSDALTFTMMP